MPAQYRDDFSREGNGGKLFFIHEMVNLCADIRVQGAVHAQNVNVYHSRMRECLRPFHGVATRYLANDLGWRKILDARRIHSPKIVTESTTGNIPTSDGDIAKDDSSDFIFKESVFRLGLQNFL
jgi:hypothetical protein